MSSNKEPDAWMWYCGGFQRAFTDDKEKVETLVQNGWVVEPLYRDCGGKIAAQQRVLNGLAEMLGVEVKRDGLAVDDLVEAVERLKEQQFTDLCNSADVKRLISVVAFPDNYADHNFSEMAKRVLAKMEQNDKALAGGEAENV